MISDQGLWSRTRDELVQVIESLGFQASLGEAIAKHLGSPKAMERMIAYLNYVKPRSEELVVNEMLAQGKAPSFQSAARSAVKSMHGVRRKPAKKRTPGIMKCCITDWEIRIND